MALKNYASAIRFKAGRTFRVTGPIVQGTVLPVVGSKWDGKAWVAVQNHAPLVEGTDYAVDYDAGEITTLVSLSGRYLMRWQYDDGSEGLEAIADAHEADKQRLRDLYPQAMVWVAEMKASGNQSVANIGQILQEVLCTTRRLMGDNI